MNKNVTVTIQDSDGVAQSVSVITATWEREMKETGEFSISVKNDQGETSQPNFDLIVGADGTEGHKARSVLISESGVEKFHGIIDHTNIRNSEILASGRGNSIKLAWRKRQTLLEQTATPADDVFDTLLTSHDDITQDATDRITTNVSVLYPKGENDYINIYSTVFNYLNAECEVTTDDVLHVKTSLGTDRSTSTVLAFGTNIIAVEREIDSFEIANNIEVTSFSEGTFQLTSGPTSDATSVADYGQRDLLVPARNATFQDEIDNRLTNLLASEKDPKDSISDVLFLDDSGDDLQIGDTVTVTNPRLGLSGTYRIFRLAYAWSTSGYFTMATMSNIFRTSSKQIANLSHRLEIERIYPQGSPMLVNPGFPLYALDVNKDIEYRFEIPDDSDWNVVINRAKITLDLDAYRSWQKTGTSTTHDHSISTEGPHPHGTSPFTGDTAKQTTPTATNAGAFLDAAKSLTADTWADLISFTPSNETEEIHAWIMAQLMDTDHTHDGGNHRHKWADFVGSGGTHTNQETMKAKDTATPGETTTDQFDLEKEDNANSLYTDDTQANSGGVSTVQTLTLEARIRNVTDGSNASLFTCTVKLNGTANFPLIGYGDFKDKSMKVQIRVLSTTSTWNIAAEADYKDQHVHSVDDGDGASVQISGSTTGFHDHSITAQGSHTHPVDSGITETSDFPEDVEIHINGTKRFGPVGSGATNESADFDGGSKSQIRNIDIKAYVVVGENTLLFKSTGAGSLGMIGMHGLVRIFAQSRA